MRSDLTRRQRQLMETLYQLGEATANEVLDHLPDKLANATVRTQLRLLEEKGLVRHRQDGKRFVYRPTGRRQSVAASALRKVLDVFFGGSVEDAIATHLADPKTQLSPEEIKRLRKLLSEHQTNR